jgi:hypothetical protein
MRLSVRKAIYFYFFFFLGFECAKTDPAKLLKPLGEFLLRTSPETLLAVLKLESALLNFVFMLGSFAMIVLQRGLDTSSGSLYQFLKSE